MNTTSNSLEQLIARKRQLRFESKIQEDKIVSNLKFLQQHGGKLALNSVTSAILPKKLQPGNQSKPSTLPLTLTDIALGGASTLLRRNKGVAGGGVWPLLWGIAQPFVLTWGIKGAKKLIGGIFSRKKKKKKKK